MSSFRGGGRGGRKMLGGSFSPRSSGGFSPRSGGFSPRSGGNGGRFSRSGGRGGRYNRGANLNPLMFVKRAEDEAVEVAYVPTNKFSDFPLTEQLMKNIVARGYVNPTPIQDQAIAPLLEGKDLVGIANTGTGKTAAFLIPLINKIVKDRKEKVLIIAPTRELAAQIKSELELFATGMGMGSVLIIGGASMGMQIAFLRRNPGFVIGTPGRVKDLTKRGMLRLEEYNNVVLDEVDRMLDMGFIKDIKEIISKLPSERQSLFFSATMPESTREIMQKFLRNPVTVSVKTGNTAKNVDQDIVRIAGRNKIEVLHELLITQGFDKVLVFGETKWGVNKLEIALKDKGFKVAANHGNKSQAQRQRAIAQLKENGVQVLLATDVASRGLDIEGVTHVINYDMPGSYEDYVHRIGRTGRAGHKGVALTFVD